jgi:hypothetical protein
LFENLPPDFPLLDNSKPVSLTITAICKLGTNGIDFSRLQDLYRHSELFKDADEHLNEGLEWLE